MAYWLVKLSLRLLFLVLNLPRGSAASTDDPVPIGYYCPVNGYSYSAGSMFEENLKDILVTHMVANASRVAFSRFTMGEGIDQVYAMYYCRGDVTLEACHDCLQSATARIINVCKRLKQGIVWYKQCTLRYANHTIFSLTNQDLTIRYPNFNNTPVLGNYLNEYRSTFDSTMRNLIDRAANNASLRPVGFATAQVNLSSFQSLRGVVQCAPIISGVFCERCLTAALTLMDLWANSMEFLPACFVGFEIYGLPSSTPPSPPSPVAARYKVLIGVLSAVVILSLLAGFWFWKRYSSKGNPHPPPGEEKNDHIHDLDEYDASAEDNLELIEKGRQHGLTQYTYYQVEDMTNGFNKQLGEGGYAVVYHGILTESSREVAVKVFSKSEAPKQFSTEIEVLGRISHKNLVSLVGYCEEETKLALIYEFMEMGDLKALLSERSDSLSWKKRIEIAIDTAQGLDYLHNGCSPPIVHRDVKPANILLNKEFRAKVADFGFSKIFPAEYVSNLHTRVVGTLGYLDPQYNLTGTVNEKGDVYSFGVVLLELVTGKTAIMNRVMNLGIWVRSVLETGDIGSILDTRLRQDVDNYITVWKTVELAVRCIQLESAERPPMTQIVTELKECLIMINTGSSSSAKDSLELTSAAVSSSTMSPTPR
ncbi:probable leucine-rich repeat receptor-like protein kinase At2g28990 [Beta vulgaris subsp. vulgaris]|uniref:probable leucine-rich repeat receptor-like protein kinase At2g28990 n=1 Tax=Beta vulgaris subsp. vulgaris TaxID=3555 RepID=UPI00053FA7AC|nr:probable leucine-rich repeat receptor-like protein kinase At2g28990 [Beta vulgaris subsp. vulgaris]